MTRRDRAPQRPNRGMPSGIPLQGYGAPPAPPSQRPVAPPDPTWRDRLADAGPAALALLPLRFFFGATFLYAGLDKLIDPAFLDASNPASIVAQLQGFARVSPLAPLIRVSEPFAVPIGLLIAVAEIAIGVGALSGLAFRLAAVGGAALSLLLWLTASWSTTPYYLGADLPYAAGWVALVIGGTGGLLVPDILGRLGLRDDEAGARGGPFRPGYSRAPTPAMGPAATATRRLMLETGVLGAAAIVVASLGVPLRAIRGDAPALGADTGDNTGGTTGPGTGDTGPGTGDTAGPDASPQASTRNGGPAGDPTGNGASAAPGSTVSATNGAATIAQVDSKGAVRVRLPADTAEFAAGTAAFIVKLTDGSYTAYDAICTHEGCRVGWDRQDSILVCPCHGAAFDPNDHGAVLGGPTRTPLTELPIVIDKTAGTITLRA